MKFLGAWTLTNLDKKKLLELRASGEAAPEVRTLHFRLYEKWWKLVKRFFKKTWNFVIIFVFKFGYESDFSLQSFEECLE